MRWILLALLSLHPAAAAQPEAYELRGAIRPAASATVTLFGATTPFTTSTLADERGRFRVRGLARGTYTVSVFVPGLGEARQTVEVGPGTAGAGRRVQATLEFKESDFVLRDALRRRHAVSARQLAIPEKAAREYEQAEKDLTRRDAEGAARHLERAVEIAPQFANAWNTLGTIHYQTRRFAQAEECFRRSLEEDPEAYEPLVNLGGVLVTVHKLDEALDYNLHAVLVRPGDALANSQLGMTYFELLRFDLALKYLERARQIDPAHFSHPQLLLAEIHLRQGERSRAADALDDFLTHHPDWPQAGQLRSTIAKLRN
jgi:tetratricopeptide (TPR) repeat protein